ncbi:MAG: DNA-binding/PHP domain-containing protein, DNA polymerase (family X) [Candidatus Peregrinibacteria bacterium GW2011_GWE2_39_6]|nr:MAG: DNA-binding/PHP domain-containing protein, DNA polymerase (family X) [Candidatus Peregrinibacteria bacterium GW2011_GWF2_39_17]KKR25720.1 MAG: DNA-binding/PHP domain-containing protein, DNA polymerase (family X) [Candidatus Peregrinibacteria bacterium GW2011_GWE2_39_6]HCW32899.1 DNA polymerase/3'-5' exonuclease PolX [Candidatus Peregrinibacteria bacterium]
MENKKIAQIFQEIGDILELMGENRFRYLSYHRAAQTLNSLSIDVRQIYEQNPKKLLEINGIGQGLADRIIEILKTGKCQEHQQLLTGFHKGLLELLTIRGLGPQKVKKLYFELEIDDLKKLKKAALEGKIAKLAGMGEKSQAEIIKAINEHEKNSKRVLLHVATFLAEDFIKYMKQCPSVKKVEYAGSLRRGNETIGDIDILATGTDKTEIINHFIRQPDIETIFSQGETKASILLTAGIQVDLRVVEEKSFGAALYYFTGSKAHNIHARKIAISKGLKLNEYGIYQGTKALAGKTELEMFTTLGLPYIPPELREDQGEIEAGYSHNLPDSIELKDIKGDLHVHTEASDGQNTLEEMVFSAQKLGYEYLAITDHSPHTGITHGLSGDRFLNHLQKIDQLNKKLKNFRILKGAEVDILEDGSLDYPNEVLALLDIVGISVHSKFNLPAHQQTTRIIKAISNPYVSFLCHPTGQIINQRNPYDIDIVEIARAAKKYHVALEINSNTRLDLSANNVRLAKLQGAKFVIVTDAHRLDQLTWIQFGIKIAKKGWLEKNDILNSLPLNKMLTYFRTK